MTARPVAAALVAALLTQPATAGTTDERIPDSSYVTHGRSFRAYVRRVSGQSVNGKGFEASGVQIAAGWVLTAAHVVDQAVSVEVEGVAVSVVFVHPDWRDEGLGRSDLALLRCDVPAGYVPPLGDGTEAAGDVVSLAGYGMTGRLGTGVDLADGELRAGTSRIDRVAEEWIVCPARSRSPMPWCSAPGDSGGPVFVGSGAKARLVGIISGTWRDRIEGAPPLASRDGEEQVATRVAPCREWIEAVRGMVR